MDGNYLGLSTLDMVVWLFKELISWIFLAWPIWVIVVIGVLFRVIPNWLEGHALARAGIGNIDQLSARTLEKYLEGLFLTLGYTIENTLYVGDFGVDLIISKVGERVVVQTKRAKGLIGTKTIQEAISAQGKYECDKAMIVTNGFFTVTAKEMAKDHNVELWDRRQLIKALLPLKDSLRDINFTVTR